MLVWDCRIVKTDMFRTDNFPVRLEEHGTELTHFMGHGLHSPYTDLGLQTLIKASLRLQFQSPRSLGS